MTDEMMTDKLIVPSPTNPIAVVKMFVETFHKDVYNTVTIKHHRNTLYKYDGSSWPELEENRLASELYEWLSEAWYWKKTSRTEELVEFEPTRYKLRDLLDALQALVHLDASVTAPAWIGVRDRGPVVPVANGLLDISTRELHDHTPCFFSQHVLPFKYDPDAPYPTRWLEFLSQLWSDETESADTLAEVMGYVLGGGTELQKIFMLVGPRRSGKGTVGRVLTGLLGAHNVAAPTLSGMTTNFGISPLIGKPLALISDARLGSRADSSIAVERLLSISGEDSLTVDRKYRDPWTGRLPTRFMVLTNEVPRFADSSGALASRFVMLVLTNSFLGRENPRLTDQLLAEAPGIFNWSLDGLDRLHERGYFQQPPTAREALRRLEDLSSPVSAFVRDHCQVGPAFEVTTEDLWAAWKRWCTDEGRDRAGTKAVFARDLHAAYPGIRPSRPRVDGKRVRGYEGIGLRGPTDPDDDDLEQQWTGARTTLDQAELVRDVVPDLGRQNGTSEHVVRDGPGSSALYPPQEVISLRTIWSEP